MKKRSQNILIAIMATIVPLSVYAQQDVTATYLINPGFEEGPSFFHDGTVVIHGWNISKTSLLNAYLNQNDGTPAPEGLNIFGVWSPGTIADFEISQTVQNLPAGTYSISCVLTTTKLEYTTQRMFVWTPSSGTKALYYESASLDTITGEKYSYAGYPDDGNGNGPFRLMTLKIKVAAGDDLVFGIRTNGTKSIICPILSTLGKNGHFKVDNFKLNFIADEVLVEKPQIQSQIDLVKAIRTDSVPRGYIPVIAAKISWGDAEVATQTNVDSLDACLEDLTNFIGEMKVAKTSFLNLIGKKQQYEVLVAAWGEFSGRDLLDAAYEEAVNTLRSETALKADFDKAYADLYKALITYSVDRVPENLALRATITTSFISSWEKMSGITDGYEPKNSTDKNDAAYGNWDGTNGKTNWVQFEWPTYMNLSDFNIYWWCDNYLKPSLGGITQPLWSKLEYNKDGAWVLVSQGDTAVNKWNRVPLAIKTNKIRISMAGTVATGILEVKIMGVGKIGPDVPDYKMLINDELIILKDSLPKYYADTIATLKAQSDNLLLGTDSLALMAYYTTLKTLRIFLEPAAVSFKALNKTLGITMVAINASTSTVIKPRLQTLYDNGLAVLMSNTSLKDIIDKTNTSLNAYLTLSPTLVTAKDAVDSSISTVIKPKLQSLYDNSVAVFTAPTSSDATINAANTSLNAYLTFNTTLITAKVALDKSTDSVLTVDFQKVYDNNVAVFIAPTSSVATINTANTSLIAYLNFISTLLLSEVPKTVNVTTAGTLKTLLTTAEMTTVTNLTVTGTIDAQDFKFIQNGITNLAVLDIGAVTVQAYNGTGGTSTATSYPANELPQRSFYQITKHTDITIPNSVTSIGDYAFSGCSGLTSINIPNSVTSIGYGAFSGCSRLTSINIPNSVTSIGSFGFSGCSGLTSINIPNSVTSIGSFGFSGCSGLTSINISNSVESIADYAFNGCSNLTSITIPNSVTSIGNRAFYGCTNFTSITIPNSVISIGEYAFSSCSKLTSLIIGNSVTSIGQAAFWGCSGLTSLTIPNSVTSIGNGAFYYCSRLTGINIPNSVTSIGNSAFVGCSGLTSLTISNSVTSIGNETFSDCSKLTSLIIGNSVTSIGDLAFRGCKGLTSLNIPNSVTSIGNSTFLGCSGLTSLIIGNSVTSIGEAAFDACRGLTSLNIPNSVTSIGIMAFYGCSGLTSINIPNSVTSIGNSAFYGCSNLVSIYVYATNPASLGSDVFYLVNVNACTLYVPAGSKSAYQAASIWRGFNIVEMAPIALPTLESESINIYPNPVTDAFYVNGLAGIGTLTLAGLSGKSLLIKQVKTNDYISVGYLPKGVYIVKIATAKGIIVRKVIKE